MRDKQFKRTLCGLAALAALGAAGGVSNAYAADEYQPFEMSVSGYLRGWASMNLENQAEVRDGLDRKTRGRISMLRGSALVDVDAKWQGLKFKTIARLDKELPTSYLEDLEDLRALNGTAGGKKIQDNYNNFDVREFWVEGNLGDRTTVKFGRQQLVWGESDFFHAMDLVHGYDLSWRLFFEGENEEWRKPLILLSTKIRVPELKGLLAAYVRPGWDRCEDIGNTYDIAGGRWFFQPYRGFDLTQVTTKNCEHKAGDYKDVTGGVRWQGEAFDINYSIAYLTTFSADPVASSAFNPYKGVPMLDAGNVFDRIHPKIDVFGLTASGYSETLDAVLSAEMSYTKDQPYNYGTGGLIAPNPAAPGTIGLGLDGVKTKNVLTTMLRVDKNLKFENLLGTSRPSFSSVQLFNTTVLNYKRSDDLVRLFAYGSHLRENNTILTAFTVLNYSNDEINPGLAVGFDLSNGGGFAIPSVALTLDDKWVAKVEADIFWDEGRNNKTGFSGQNSQLFGYFHHSSQLVFRLTRQF